MKILTPKDYNEKKQSQLFIKYQLIVFSVLGDLIGGWGA